MQKRFTRIFAVLAFIICFAASCLANAADLSKLIFLHTNDVHGYCMRNGERLHNGIAAVAGLKKSLEAQGFTVFLLDAGDAIQDNNLVNLSKGQTLVEFYNAAGYDAATFGNHEFDYGQDVLIKRIKEANYPYVCANIIVEATGKTFAPPYVLLKKNGYKVGVIGLDTPTVPTSTHPKNVRGLKFLGGQEMFAATQKIIDELKAQGVDAIVAITHLGSEELSMGNNSEDVLNNTHGLDMLFDGHDHMMKSDYVNSVPRGETGSYTKNIGIARFIDGAWKHSLIPYGVLAPKNDDPTVAKIIAKAQKGVDKQLARKISSTGVLLNGNREPGVRTEETNLGDFVADAILWQSNLLNSGSPVIAAIVNGGSLRYSINAGTISENDVRRVMPYANNICTLTLSGAKLHEIIEASCAAVPAANGGFPQVAGIEYQIDTRQPFVAGKQYPNSKFSAPAKLGTRVQIKTVGGQPFDPNAQYKIVCSTFIAAGGDSYGGLLTDENGEPFAPSGIAPATPPEAEDLGLTDLDAVINYLGELAANKIAIADKYPAPAGRITIIK